MLVIRGIMVHCAVWLVSCLVHPFVWSGLSHDTLPSLVAASLGFAIGLPLLLVGSALGDPHPTLHQYWTPAIIAFVLGIILARTSETWPQRLQGVTKRWSERSPVEPRLSGDFFTAIRARCQ